MSDNWTEEELAEFYRKLKEGGDAPCQQNSVPTASSPSTTSSTGSDAPRVREFSGSHAARRPRHEMNRWEAEYAEGLAVKYLTGIIDWWGFEPFTLRLAKRTTYTPDFAVIDHARLCFHEIKGFLRDDANDKFKIAAELFPFEFFMYRKRKKAEGGGWELIKHLNAKD